MFERLIEMQPVTVATLPKNAPSPCIYLFSETGRHLDVGRTHRQSLRKRLRQHSIDSAQHNQAVFAFKLAREATGHLHAGYTARDSRTALALDPEFSKAFRQAKKRVQEMEVRFVAESDAPRNLHRGRPENALQ